MSAVTEGPETKHDIAEGMSASSEKAGTTAGALSDDTTKGGACNC